MKRSEIDKERLVYYDEMHYFCLKNCFNNCLILNGIEDSLLRIRTGLEFKIRINYDKTNFNVLKHTLLLPFFDMNQVTCGMGDDSEEIFNDNISKIPIIVLVDVYYLPYRKEYHKYHASHAVLLVGYDESMDFVEIIDWYGPYFYIGEIPYDEYLNARNSDNPNDVNPFSGFKINNYWYKIGVECKIDIKKNLIENLNGLRGDRKLITNNSVVGKEAVNTITTIMQKKIEAEDIEIKRFCGTLHNELYILSRATELSILYYTEIKKKNSNMIDDRIILFVKNINESFKKMNYWLLKGSIKNSRDYLKKVLTKWIEFEKEYNAIEQVINDNIINLETCY